MQPETAVCVPALCMSHQRMTVDRLHIPESGPWQAAIVIVNVLLFGRAIADDRVVRRIGTNLKGVEFASTASLVLAEIGCLGCFDRDATDRAINLIKARGLQHAAEVARGVITHPYWHPKGKAE